MSSDKQTDKRPVIDRRYAVLYGVGSIADLNRLFESIRNKNKS